MLRGVGPPSCSSAVLALWVQLFLAKSPSPQRTALAYNPLSKSVVLFGGDGVEIISATPGPGTAFIGQAISRKQTIPANRHFHGL